MEKSFLDRAFTDEGVLKSEVVQQEAEKVADTKDRGRMLLETDVIAESESGASSESEGEINKAAQKRVLDRNYQEELDQRDVEGMVRVLVQPSFRGKTSKLHLPALPLGFKEDDDLPLQAAPKCGAHDLKADDAMDATVGFCVRCSPSRVLRRACANTFVAI